MSLQSPLEIQESYFARQVERLLQDRRLSGANQKLLREFDRECTLRNIKIGTRRMSANVVRNFALHVKKDLREVKIEDIGYIVLRFWDDEVFEHPETCLGKISRISERLQ